MSQPGKRLAMGQKGDAVLRQSLGEVVAAIIGTYSSNARETAQMADGSFSTTPNLLTLARSPQGT